MPKYKQPDGSTPESIEQAWRENGEIGAVKASILKYAKVLDMTDSGRDIKPLVSGMFEMVDRLKALESRDSEAKADTPLYQILKLADG
ncbi:MAG: hypothetical protein IIZ78_20315 [Clostridiales bacterium]|jgi:hypothetical protein|nr:hypothetical protein [Clostridiales bacterium]